MREKERIRRKIVVWFTVRSAHGPLFGRAVAPYRRDQEGLHDSVLFRDSPLSWRGNPPGERYSETTSLAPRIYEVGGPRSGRGSSPAAVGTALSVALRAPALPRGEPRALRTVPAPRIYEGGGPRSGRGSSPQRRGKPPQSRLRRASSPRGEAESASHRSCPRIYEGGGPRSGRGSPPPQWGRPLSAARCASAEFRFPRYPSQKISPFPIWKRGKSISYCQPSMVLNSCMYFPAGTSQLKSCSMSRRTRLSKAGRFSRYRPMQRLMAARKSSPL